MTIATVQADAPILSDEDKDIMEALLQPREGAVAHGGPSLVREVLKPGEEDIPMAMGVQIVEDAGVVVIYDLKTGEPSRTSANMLAAQIKKLGGDGQRMFSLRPQAQPSERKRLKCLLHPDRRAPEWDEWGLPVCHKTNLPSPLEVDNHMAHRHPGSWAAIKADRDKRDREEERALQRQIAAAAIQGRTH